MNRFVEIRSDAVDVKLQDMTPSAASDESSSTDVPSEADALHVFDRLDVGSRGVLSLTGIQEAVLEIWPHFHHEESVIIRAYQKADLNGDGKIGRNEFVLLLHFLSHHSTLRQLCEGKRSGESTAVDCRLTKEQFVREFSKLNFWDAGVAFDDLDVNNNGLLALDDICFWMAMRSAKRKISTGACYRIANSSSARLLSNSRSGETTPANIIRIFLDLRNSMDLLGVTVSDQEVESWAVLINACMSGTDRAYHNIQRVFGLSEGADPIQMIAALFHDCVRYSSFGLSPEMKNILDEAIEIRDERIFCSTEAPFNGIHFAMVYSMYGFTPGQMLSFQKGIDRFLSALFAVCILKEKVSIEQLAKIVVCICATTVFQYLDAQYSALKYPKTSLPEWCKQERLGETSDLAEHRLDQLYERFVAVNDMYHLGMPGRKIVKAIQRAADMSNRCYGWYAYEDTSKFLDTMWSWLPEANPALRSMKLYTISDYHLAVKVVSRVIGNTQIEKVLTSFRGVPAQVELRGLVRKTRQNQQVAILYINAHIVSLAILSAFAELTGGDVPVAYFVGDHPSERRRSDQLGDGLPHLEAEELADCDPIVYEVLVKGRGAVNAFDVHTSPVTAFVYGSLGDEGIDKAMAYTDHPMDKERSKALLSLLPTDVVFLIGKEIAKIAVSRTTALEALLKELERIN